MDNESVSAKLDRLTAAKIDAAPGPLRFWAPELFFTYDILPGRQAPWYLGSLRGEPSGATRADFDVCCAEQIEEARPVDPVLVSGGRWHGYVIDRHLPRFWSPELPEVAVRYDAWDHPVTAIVAPSGLLRLVEIIQITLLLLFCLALPAAAYDRPRWADTDRDCKDTRAEVLERQCASVTWDARGCRVRQAVCLDMYSGAEIATDTASQALQVDHIYPASVAGGRGTWLLPDGSRCARADRCPAYSAFFNDPLNLLATRSRTNGQKSDRMPGEWCPATRGARILAADRLRAVADRYRLPLTARDEIGLRAWAAGGCAPRAAVLGGVR